MCIGGRLIGRCCRPHPPNVHIKQEKPKPVPLSGVIVTTKIVDFVAEVTIHQRYENVEDVPIEATYEFPLVEGASVCSFYAIVDGKKVEGKIQEKEKAKDQYDDAIASGNSAYLLEEVTEKKNVFKTSIGNLPPKEEVIITIVYVSELSFTEDKKLEFVLPTNLKAYPDGVEIPRFFVPTKVREYAKNIVVPSFGLKVDISLDMTSKIKSISSPSHPIEFNAGDTPNSATVNLANPDIGVPLLKDFEMRVTLANPDSPVFRVQDGVGMLALYPNLIEDDEDPITEMIFLVDRSGSMSGTKIQRVKDTLHIFLRSLPLGTLFNIVGFGTNYVSLFQDGSKEYDDKTLEAATKHVNDLKANLGGTALAGPLKHIFSQPLREGIPRQIFVLTDGEVDNSQECIDIVREQSTKGRVFAFGIQGASPELVNGLAKAGEGKAELIFGNESIEGKVMIQLKRALQPALTDLRIDWGTLKAEQTPFKLPPLFSGSRLIAYGYLAPDAAPGTVVFTANSVKGSPYKFEHPVTVDDLKPIVGGINFIPKLAARSMIRDLEEKRSYYHFQAKRIDDAQSKQKAIALSIKSGILSKYTAFIAVSENDKAIEQTMETRDVNKLAGLEKSKQKVMMPKTMAPATRSGGIRALSSRMSSVSAAPRAPPASMFLSNSMSSFDDGSSGSEEDLDYEEERSDKRGGGGGGGKGGFGRGGAAPKAREMRERKEDAKTVQKAKKMNVSMDKLAKPARNAAPLMRSSSSSTTSVIAESASAPSSGQSGLRDIVLQQKAAGNFTEDALKLVGGSLDKLRANVPEQLKSLAAALLDQILITAFICGVLKTKHADEADQWSLVEKKAFTWIKKEAKKANEGLATFDWNAFAVQLAKL